MSVSRTDELLASADYQPLLQNLKKIVEAGAQRKLFPGQHQGLEEIIRIVADLYYVVPPGVAKYLSFITRIAEIGAPLTRVIEILEDERCRDWVLLCLEGRGLQRLNRQEVPARYEGLLVDLHKIACRVPPPRIAKRGRGKPKKSDDLEKIVELLGLYWKETTGKPMTRNWHRREPINPAMMFVHAVIGFIDAKRLDELPTVTRTVAEAKRDKQIL